MEAESAKERTSNRNGAMPQSAVLYMEGGQNGVSGDVVRLQPARERGVTKVDRILVLTLHHVMVVDTALEISSM